MVMFFVVAFTTHVSKSLSSSFFGMILQEKAAMLDSFFPI